MATLRFDLNLARQRDEQGQTSNLEQEPFKFEDYLYHPSWLRNDDEIIRQG